MTSVKHRGRRPATEQQQVCETLLAVAERILEIKTYKEITLREVAEQADVSQAMVNYYFKNKEGLFLALVEHVFAEQQRELQTLQTYLAGMTTSPTHELLQIIKRSFYCHRPTIKLLAFEAMQKDSTLLAQFYEKSHLNNIAALQQFIEAAVANGIYRQDIDVKYLTLIVSQLALRIINTPNLEATYNCTTEELLSDQWLDLLEQSLDNILLSSNRKTST